MRREPAVARQRGMVSLITAIILSLLLLIITISLSTLMAGEQRQAADADQSVKAYYAAAAGVEDAVHRINAALAANQPLPSQSCPGSNGPALDAGGATFWTCQRIVANDTHVDDFLERDSGVREYDFINTGMKSLRISWNQPSDFAIAGSSTYAGPAGQFNGTAPWQFPAAIEVTSVNYPATSFQVNSGSLTSDTTVVTPEAGNMTNVSHLTPRTAGQCSSGSPLGNGYNCYVDIGSYNDVTNHVIRLRARYRNARFRIEAFSCNVSGTAGCAGGGAQISIPSKTVLVDVTGRSGDVYRRIVENVVVKSNAAGGLDYAIFSDRDLCKDFYVREAVNAAFGGACDVNP